MHFHSKCCNSQYTEPKTGQVVNLLINQVIEMKGIDHHALCPMQCCINEFPKFLASILNETTHATQLETLSMPPTQLLLSHSLLQSEKAYLRIV